MRNIRSTGTTPERIVMKALRQKKIYFACHVKSLPGKPDIVFRRKRIAVFVDSDFWHGHPTRFRMPQGNIEYWRNKIAGNRKRDKDVNRQLRKAGWRVIRFWDYDVKHNLEKTIDRILKARA